MSQAQNDKQKGTNNSDNKENKDQNATKDQKKGVLPKEEELVTTLNELQFTLYRARKINY